MSPKQKGLVHTLAGLAIPAGFFQMLPAPWNMYLGALSAALIAFVAFLDQSLSE